MFKSARQICGGKLGATDGDIDRISYEESKLFLNVTKDFVLHSPVCDKNHEAAVASH